MSAAIQKDAIDKYLLSYFASRVGHSIGLTRETRIRELLNVTEWVSAIQGLNNLPYIQRLGVKIAEHAVTDIATIGALSDLIFRMASEHRSETPGSAEGEEERDLTALGDADESVNAEYTVWYGTNRKPKNGHANYSFDRDDVTHYGQCRVFIPKSHKIGSIGSPFWKRLLTMTDDRLRLLETTELKQDNFWREITNRITAAEPDQRKAVVFIHGYNVSFNEAALRAAQIGFDLSIRGAMAFFSWPSRGTLKGYMADEATIQVSEDAIAQFLVDFAERSQAKSVHIIAHSMGNRALLESVGKIATEAKRRSSKPFSQVILAAADVDADRFRQRCAAYADVAIRTTLYVSAKDVAVGSSRWLHGSVPRAGLIPPILVLPSIDTINVTNVDLTALGHGYIAAARDVLRDMHELIEHSAEPNRRFATRPAFTRQGEQFWEIGV